KAVRGDVPGDDRTGCNDRILAHRHAAEDGRSGCDPHAILNHNGLSYGSRASLRRLKGVARRDDAHVRPNHHIVRDIEAAKVVESAVLIYEDITPDADFVSSGRVKRRNQ